MSTWRGASEELAARAGTTAVAAWPDGAGDEGPAGLLGGACGVASGSRISALSPLPNAFLVIGDDLLCELNIAFSAFTTNVVEYYRLSVAWGFCQTDIPGNHRSENLGAEEAAKIGRDLFRQRRAVVVHRQQDSLDSQRRINRATQPHQCIEEFGDTFHGIVLALDRDQNGVTSSECINGLEIQSGWAIDENVLV